MAIPQQKTLRHDVLHTQQKLATLEQIHGKHSTEYQDALKHFSRMWSLLKMTRAREDFLQDLVK